MAKNWSETKKKMRAKLKSILLLLVVEDRFLEKK